jgi:hypothetical protein
VTRHLVTGNRVLTASQISLNHSHQYILECDRAAFARDLETQGYITCLVDRGTIPVITNCNLHASGMVCNV